MFCQLPLGDMMDDACFICLLPHAKIITNKLSWEAKSKINSLENTSHKPGGGDKKIESIRTEFKDKAKSRVGSKDNVKHTPGGGDVKVSPYIHM